jgi:predicted dehydrogenase
MKELKDWTGNAFGKGVNEVSDVEEMGIALISFDNGADLLFSVSNNAHIKQDYKIIEILGTKGGLIVDPQLEIHTVANNRLFDGKPVVNCDKFDYQGSIDSQAEHFISCIRDGTSCISTSANGVKIMKTVDAIYRSAQSGEAVLI